MKKLLLTTVLAVATIVAMANPIGRTAAMQKAQDFMRGINPQAQLQAGATPRKAMGNAGSPAYYIFNAENNQGFVIASGDDRSEEILGYADSGSIDVNNMPEMLQAMLDGFVEELKELDEKGIIEAAPTTTRASGPRKAMSTGRKPIAPLTTSKWSQGAPWTNLLPNHNKGGSTAKPPQGCGICCLSQMVYYWKYLHMTKEIPAYTMNTDFYEGTFPKLPIREFNFDLMQDDYTYSSYTTEQANEVATLTLYILQAMKSRFTHEHATSTSSSSVPTIFPSYFGYTMAPRIIRNEMTPNEFENFIYNDIRQGIPAIIGGSNPEWGHFFIADGYGYDGYFHINWGWGGQADGYFLLSPLNSNNYPTNRGFSNTMWGIFGFRPKVKYDRNPDYDPNAYEPYKTVDDFTLRLRTLSFFNGTLNADSTDKLLTTSYSVNKGNDGKYSFQKLQIRTYLENFTDLVNVNNDRQFDTEIAIYDQDCNYVGNFGSQEVVITNKNHAIAYYDLKNIDLPDGEYYFVHRSKASESSDGIFHISEENGSYGYAHVKATIADNKMTVALEKSIEFERVELFGQCADGWRTGIRFHVKNNSFNKVKRIYNLYRNVIRDKDDEILQDNKGMFIPARSTGYLDMDFNPGSEDAKLILYNRDLGKTDYTYNYTVNPNPVSPTNILSLTWHIDNTEGSYLYGNELSGYVEVYNSSNAEYSDLLTVMSRTGVVAHNGSVKYGSNIYPVRIPAKGSVKLDIAELKYADEYDQYDEGLAYGNTFDPYVYYGKGTIQYSLGHKKVTVTPGIMWWDKNGKMTALAATTGTYRVPEEAVAVSFLNSWVKNYWSSNYSWAIPSSITPNANPNCIYYFAQSSHASKMTTTSGKNIVINGEAANDITFKDNYGAFVPITFTAKKKVSYTRQFAKGFEGNESERAWSTICLPFTVQKITNKAQNTDIDFFRYEGDKEKNFWLRKYHGEEFHTLYFDYPDAMEANVPYIISMPGETYKEFGDGWCLTGKDIVFSAENTEVLKGLGIEDSDNFNFMSSTTASRYNYKKSLFGLVERGNYFSYQNGTVENYNGFNNPFRAYVTGDVVPATDYEKQVKIAQRFPMDLYDAREIINHRFPAIRFTYNGLTYEVPAWDEVVESDAVHTRLQSLHAIKDGDTSVPSMTITNRAWSVDSSEPVLETFDGGTANITIARTAKSVSTLTYGEACDLLNLEIADADRNVKVFDFYENATATELTLPGQKVVTSGVNAGRTFTVEEIGAGTYNCSTLSTINIPAAVKLIDSGAFANCSILNKVTFEGAEPPAVEGEPFAGVKKNRCAVYVPAKTVKAYRESNELWNDFIFAMPVSATNKFVSFCSDVDFTSRQFNGTKWVDPSAIKMYWANKSKNNDPTYLSLSMTDDKETFTIPAGFGLVMKTSSEGGSGYIFMPPVGASHKAVLIEENNMLKGVTELTQMGPIVEAHPENKYYILDHPNYPNTFVRIKDLQLSAGRAYLEMPTSLGASEAKIMVTLEDETDGILLINSDEQNANGSIYDIQGRKVENPTKGIYIVNGKKVVMK